MSGRVENRTPVTRRSQRAALRAEGGAGAQRWEGSGLPLGWAAPHGVINSSPLTNERNDSWVYPLVQLL